MAQTKLSLDMTWNFIGIGLVVGCCYLQIDGNISRNFVFFFLEMFLETHLKMPNPKSSLYYETGMKLLHEVNKNCNISYTQK
jgi:hypothetical protein